MALTRRRALLTGVAGVLPLGGCLDQFAETQSTETIGSLTFALDYENSTLDAKAVTAFDVDLSARFEHEDGSSAAIDVDWVHLADGSDGPFALDVSPGSYERLVIAISSVSMTLTSGESPVVPFEKHEFVIEPSTPIELATEGHPEMRYVFVVYGGDDIPYILHDGWFEYDE